MKKLNVLIFLITLYLPGNVRPQRKPCRRLLPRRHIRNLPSQDI